MAARQNWRMTPAGVAATFVASLVLVLISLSGVRATAAEGESVPDDTVRLQIVGGLAAVTQFSRLEQPFWETEITERSGGRIIATIRPFDAGGIRAQEMLQLIRLGVVPYGTILLSVVAPDEPAATTW